MKKITYIIAWIILGLVLSFLAHTGLEIIYIKYAIKNNIVIDSQTVLGHGYCALPAYLQLGLVILGIILGYLAGIYFWRIIYVEKKLPRWKKLKS